MDKILQAFLDDSSALEARRVEQIVAICGNGNLGDGAMCSTEFREFLENVPSKLLRKYSEECLDGTTSRNQNSGLILQDIVNEVGNRLGFDAQPGFYRGSSSRPGHDGLWISEDFSFVVEVKTTDLSIKLDTIAEYRRQLISASRITDSASSILIVLGRQDTGELEAQIRGSKHAWDTRMIGIEALFRLVDLKENLNDPRSIRRITELLKPIEYTRVDKLIDVVFSTSTDISTPELPDLPDQADQRIVPTEHRVVIVPHSQDDRHTHSSPVNFYEKCIARINQRLGKNLIKNGRVTYTSSDKSTNVVLLNSKTYPTAKGHSYWYGFRPNQADFLGEKENSYIAFGCGNENLIILIPYKEFRPWTSTMAATYDEDGGLTHRHVVIEESANRYVVWTGDTWNDVTGNKLPNVA